MKLNKTDETAFSQLACSSLKKSVEKKQNKTKKTYFISRNGKKSIFMLFHVKNEPHLAESDVTYKHAKSIIDSLSIKSFSIYPRTK